MRQKHFSGLRSSILSAIFLCGLGAGIPAAMAEEPQRGGTAVFALTQEPVTFNPDVSSGVPERMIGCTLFQGLVQVSHEFKAMPLLAKSWTISPDGLTYSFDLVHTNWHDGKPLTSEDVKYTLLDVSPKYSAVFYPAGRLIDSIDTPAPDKVVVHLKQPFGPFIVALACNQGASIMPAHIYRGTDVGKSPATAENSIGTGPFKFSEWKRGDTIRLVRNPHYFEPGKPYLDEIVAKVITQASARIQALQAGEIDYIQVLAPNDKAAVLANPKLKVEDSDITPSFNVLYFNTAHKPMDDKRVRQALAMATDRDYLMRTAFFGVGSVGVMPWTSQVKWSINPDIDYRKMYPYDTARANALLDAAGVKRGAGGKRFGVHMAIFATAYPEFQQVALAIKSMWQAIGVDVTIDAMEDATVGQHVFADRDFDTTIMSYTTYTDPAFGVSRLFVTSSIGKLFGNPSNYSNPQVDALFEQGERATSFDERGKFYKEVQPIIAEDLPVLTIREYQALDASSVKFKGLWGTALGSGRWADAWLAQ